MRWTGARPSEIFPFKAKDDGVPREPLCWKNILKHDFKAVTMVEYKDTIRVERVIPARPELQQCLRDLYARRPLAKPDDLLFPFKSFPRAWKTVCELAGIESGKAGTVSRDFRAYFNNKLIEWKTPDVIRMLIMGHTDVKSNKDYSLITPEVINSFQFGPVVEVSAAVN
jgi:integrase